MTRWMTNKDGSIQSVDAYKRSQFEEFKKDHFKKWYLRIIKKSMFGLR